MLIERAASADRVSDLSFNDLLRAAADASLMADPQPWCAWREMRNATSHAYDPAKAQWVAGAARAFADDAAALLQALEKAWMQAADSARVAALTPTQRRTVLAVLAVLTAWIPHTPVWLFGSRATGRSRPFSDLDLLVAPALPLAWETLAGMRDAFEASELPFRVDIVDVRDLGAGMRDRVDTEKLPLIEH